MEDKFLYKELTYQIRGACFKIWKELGNGFKESIIENALTQELKKRMLNIDRQKRINIDYEGEKVGTYIPDIVVDDKIIVELKRKPFLTKQDIKQFWHYLKGTSYKLGMLINFGDKKLQIERVIYDTAREKNAKRFASDLRTHSALDLRNDSLGFTLIELLLVVGILAVVFGLALPFALNTKFTNELDTAAENLRATLREAQSQSIAAEGDTPYGVYFDTNANPQKYTIYKGTSYTNRDTSFNAGGYGTTELPKGATMSFAPVAWISSEITFTRLTGELFPTGTGDKTITLTIPDIGSKIITVTVEGLIY